MDGFLFPSKVHMESKTLTRLSATVMLPVVLLAACSPRVEIVPPDKPITINMNIKIDHEVKVKVERDLEQVINKDSGLF